MSAIARGLTATRPAFETEDHSDRRGAPRFALLMQAAKLVSCEGEYLCVVHDASTEGVRVRHFGHLPNERLLKFELSNGEVFPVQCVWHDDIYLGLQFPAGVDLDRLVKLSTDSLPHRPMRLDTVLEGAVSTAGAEHCITIRNISQGGACIECREDLAVDHPVTVEADALQPTRATVRWRIGTVYGVVFDDPIACEDLAAVIADARRY
jgi:hypothetical protein